MPTVKTEKDFVVMPWKNGGGTTVELYKIPHPDGGFNFRLSRANVEVDGPFSLFPNVDRHLLLLEGNGFLLERESGPVELREADSIVQFQGEEKIFCRLKDGPCVDFNVMVRRGFARVNVRVIRVINEDWDEAQKGMSFVYSHSAKTLWVYEAGEKVQMTKDVLPVVFVSTK